MERLNMGNINSLKDQSLEDRPLKYLLGTSCKSLSLLLALDGFDQSNAPGPLTKKQERLESERDERTLPLCFEPQGPRRDIT